MSDLFHKDVPLEYIQQVFKVMNDCNKHQFQVLTKRADRLAELHAELQWAKNIWMGVSVENKEVLERIDFLRAIGAHIKFLSIEPLIGDLGELDLSGIDWVIVGGESGPGARQMKKEWVINIKNQCAAKGVAFFFKQWGGVNKKATGRELDGQYYNEYPNKL